MRLQLSLSLILFLVVSHKGFSQDVGDTNIGNDSIKLYVIAIEKVTRHPLNGVVILNSKGGKLSKRDPDVEPVTTYRDMGILPNALINFNL